MLATLGLERCNSSKLTLTIDLGSLGCRFLRAHREQATLVLVKVET